MRRDLRLAHQHLGAVEERLHDDRRLRAASVAIDPPSHVVDRNGHRPAESEDRARRWDIAAGLIEQHRAVFDLDDLSSVTDRRVLAECQREMAHAIEVANPPPVRAHVLERGLDLGIGL